MQNHMQQGVVSMSDDSSSIQQCGSPFLFLLPEHCLSTAKCLVKAHESLGNFVVCNPATMLPALKSHSVSCNFVAIECRSIPGNKVVQCIIHHLDVLFQFYTDLWLGSTDLPHV